MNRNIRPQRGRPSPVRTRAISRVLPVNWLSLTLAVVLGTAARAGSIDPRVREQLASQSPSAQITVVFALEQQADIPTLDRALKAQHATRRERHRRVVEALQSVAKESQGPILAAIDAWSARGEISRFAPYWISNVVVVRGTRAAIETLAGRTDVRAVEPELRVSPVEPVNRRLAGVRDGGARGIGVTPGVQAINAPRVWRELGYNGAGTIVANLDTGVDGNHPALHDGWRGNHGHPSQECWLDVLGTHTTYPNDDTNGHGTHVMGTLAGLGAATHDTISVAWGAQWIGTNALRQSVGPAFDFDIIMCFQWFADPDGDPATVDDVPDVVQNSWGVNEYLGYDDCDTRWLPFITNCEAGGTVLTWSAGGDGPAAGTIRTPAELAVTPNQCFSVGTVDASNYGFPYPIASFSSRGPTGCDVPTTLKIKPEVVAPGVDVYSSVPGAGYQVWSGSAMAGPHVAGVVALLRSADPDIDVDSIKEILMETARDEGPAGEDNAYGWGVIDAYAAMLRLPLSSVPVPGSTEAYALTILPNPFTSETSIRYRLLVGGPMILAIHDPGGRLVRTVLCRSLPAGDQTAIWDGRNESGQSVPAGVYFSVLRAAGSTEQRKLLLLR